MKSEYEMIVKDVCRLDNWRHARRHEREGAVGVACVLSFLRGVIPSISDMARDIEISSDEIKMPFRRLLVNRVFSSKYGAREDLILLGKAESIYLGDTGICYTAFEQTRNAWAIIAGIAGGFTGLRENTA